MSLNNIKPILILLSHVRLIHLIKSILDIFEIIGKWSLWMFVFKMLLVGFRIRHLSHAYLADTFKSYSGCGFLVSSRVTGLLLQLGLLLLSLLLRLDLLLTASHCVEIL